MYWSYVLNLVNYIYCFQFHNCYDLNIGIIKFKVYQFMRNFKSNLPNIIVFILHYACCYHLTDTLIN